MHGMKYNFVSKYLKTEKRPNCNLKVIVKVYFSHCTFLCWNTYILTTGFMLYQSLFVSDPLDQICTERFSPNSFELFVVVV